MGIKVTAFSVSPGQKRRLRALLPDAGWSILSSTEMSGLLPERYLEKIDSVIGVSTPTSSGGTCLLFGNLRVDERAHLIDQDPLGMFASTGASSTAVLVHHGDWDQRSREASSGLWREVQESGIGKYYLSHPPAGRRSGTLNELPDGTAGALENVLRALRGRAQSA